MTAVLVRARSELRSRRAWLGLALVAALGVGAVMTAAVGARRTDRAYGDFERAQLGADIVVLPAFGPGLAAPPFEGVRRLPEVAAAGRMYYLVAEPFGLTFGEPPVGTGVDRLKMLEGRLPRSRNEVVMGYNAARARHLHLGSRIPFQFAPSPGSSSDETGDTAGDVPATLLHVTLEVVGIEAAPGEFPPQFDAAFGPDYAHVGAATFDAFKDSVVTFESTVVRLRRGRRTSPPSSMGSTGWSTASRSSTSSGHSRRPMSSGRSTSRRWRWGSSAGCSAWSPSPC